MHLNHTLNIAEDSLYLPHLGESDCLTCRCQDWALEEGGYGKEGDMYCRGFAHWFWHSNSDIYPFPLRDGEKHRKAYPILPTPQAEWPGETEWGNVTLSRGLMDSCLLEFGVVRAEWTLMRLVTLIQPGT